MTIEYLRNGPSTPRLLLAHGAGVGMDSDFMQQMAERIAALGVGVVRFEFPYMAERRQTGKKRPPDRQPVLLDTWRQVLADHAGEGPLVIGGKSMGGRMATLLAAELEAEGCPVAGVICLGYPFHPPGKPEKLRTEHLQSLRTPVLMLQGSRDPMGSREEVQGYDLSDTVVMSWLEDGNHDLKPRVKSGFSHDQHLATAAGNIVDFFGGLC
ncbi:alpha/beta fold hydrolase [Pseudomaricurvus sp. HS19]|uniref:alpha/beta fold hydrolase n=1 Tax=Pseudomaricurvus sp. HS19 TaxID=2692626 RepID=UPI00136F5FD9|nr:alpha/beta fold hydrolase [Pseudomaricurvus sp. HS19]MYM61981.1 alpha/beta fold hydrolase [Pseudomaricurvus sp. HS19]